MCGLLPGILAGCTANGAWDDIAGVLKPTADEDPPPEEDPPLWARRMAITVDGTQSNEMLFGFPVMVRVPAGTIEEDLVNDDKDNFGFFDGAWSEGLEPLEHTLASSGPDEDYVFWVKLATIQPGSETTTLYLYYGGTETVEPAGSAVWNNGYTVVMHFEERSVEDGYIDSSPFANHSVPSAGHTEPETVAGFAGQAADFVEATDALIIPNSPSIETMQPFTFSMLVNYRAFRSVSRLLAKGDYYVQMTVNGGNLRHQFRLQFDTVDTVLDRNDALDTDVWRYMTIMWNGTDTTNSVELRRDLSLLANAGGAWGSGIRDDDSTKDLGIGNQQDLGGNRAIDGLIDELRISRVARSLTWLTTEYRSYTGDLVALGAVETLE